jgi:hypothetical protein
LQISAGFYTTQGVVFTGIPYHVLGYLSTSAFSQPAFASFDPNHPYGFPFSASATLDFAHTVLLSGATVSVGGQAVTNFSLLDENGNPFSFGSAAGAPEPGTFCLAALALLGLVCGGRFRRQAGIAFKSRP